MGCEILLTILSAAGLLFLVGWLYGRLLRPIQNPGVLGVIPGRGGGEGLEHAVRALVWLRSLGLLDCPIVIANIDLDPQGWELALHLAARWPDVALWPVGDMPAYIAENSKQQ